MIRCAWNGIREREDTFTLSEWRKGIYSMHLYNDVAAATTTTTTTSDDGGGGSSGGWIWLYVIMTVPCSNCQLEFEQFIFWRDKEWIEWEWQEKNSTHTDSTEPRTWRAVLQYSWIVLIIQTTCARNLVHYTMFHDRVSTIFMDDWIRATASWCMTKYLFMKKQTNACILSQNHTKSEKRMKNKWERQRNSERERVNEQKMDMLVILYAKVFNAALTKNKQSASIISMHRAKCNCSHSILPSPFQTESFNAFYFS